MARLSDIVRFNGRGRRPAPLDRETEAMAANRRVEAGLIMPPHYDPLSPHFGGRDLHEQGKISAPWDGSPHPEGSAIAASPLQAAVVPVENYMQQMRAAWSFGGSRPKQLGRVEQWEADVFRMMRKGPGFVGTAASMYGEWMAGSGSLVLQERAGEDSEGHDEWVNSDYEPAMEILRMWRGEEQTQADLIRDSLTYLDSVGQLYQCMRKLPDGTWVYDVWAHSAVKGNTDTGRVEARGLPDADRDDPMWFREYPPQLVDHLFLGDREWKGLPTSQMQRIIVDIYRLILAERSMDRDLMSRLATNGVFWIPATPGGRDWTVDMADWAQAAFSGTFDPDYVPGLSGSLEEVAPFAMQSAAEPKYVDIGRDVSKAMEVWKMAWNAICLGLDMPKNAMDGNEAANRWTGFLNRDEESLKAAAPRMQRLSAMVERTHFRPWARILNLGRPVNDFRVWYRLPDVRPERTQEKITLAPALVPTRQALAETVGWSSSDLADLPEGMTDFEAAFLMRHGKPLEQASAEADTAEQTAESADAAGAAMGPGPAAAGELPPGPDPAASGSPLAPGFNEPTAPPPMPGMDGGLPLAAAIPFRRDADPLDAELASWDELVPR